eukprot:4608233-Amphidinium_carterae.2
MEGCSHSVIGPPVYGACSRHLVSIAVIRRRTDTPSHACQCGTSQRTVLLQCLPCTCPLYTWVVWDCGGSMTRRFERDVEECLESLGRRKDTVNSMLQCEDVTLLTSLKYACCCVCMWILKAYKLHLCRLLRGCMPARHHKE